MSTTGSLLRALECRACGGEVDPNHLVGTCPTCGHALLATYDLARLDARHWWSALADRPRSLWRYHELLPVQSFEAVVTLGEGCTPLLPLSEVSAAPGVRLLLKDDGVIPTGSFKARGMAVAVSRARELGARALFAPSAGTPPSRSPPMGRGPPSPVRVYLPDRNTEGVQEVCRRYGAEGRRGPGDHPGRGRGRPRRGKGTGILRYVDAEGTVPAWRERRPWASRSWSRRGRQGPPT